MSLGEPGHWGLAIQATLALLVLAPLLASAWRLSRGSFLSSRVASASAKDSQQNAYLHGNFAPIRKTLPLTRCTYTGAIPRELAGGQYVRNGGNPLTNDDLGRDAHWFDGDGMLTGVTFVSRSEGGIDPYFVNKYILTDVFLSAYTTPSLRTPILPSIAALVNPFSSLLSITRHILRTVALVILSHLPGSLQAIKRISVANTGLVYHDGRALATCESGPPMRVTLPELDTVGWLNGDHAEGEPGHVESPFTASSGLLGFFREWTTAHPRRDRRTDELLLFHSSFVPPYVHYSILPATSSKAPGLREPIPGIHSPKMMHDFGVSHKHTIILDLPLSLAPQNLAVNRPVVAFDPSTPSRFGVFPRYQPSRVRWFETAACCIFHTANTWDSPEAVNLLACRLTSASLVFSAGNIPSISSSEGDQCRLYYYQFPLSKSSPTTPALITHEWALLALPFEFPSVPDPLAMTNARFVYGCSSVTNFSAALGRGVKIDALVRVDAQRLISRGIANPPKPITGCVDERSLEEILASDDPDDPVKIFRMPPGWFAQEPRFVPKDGGSEEEGWLLTYVFNEEQLETNGEVGNDATSELWVIDATKMSSGMLGVVARVALPQRVPYGFHGTWFTESEIGSQKALETVRQLPLCRESKEAESTAGRMWTGVRKRLLSMLK